MTDKAFLEAVFLLFGRRLAKVPPFPADNQIIRFNFALNQWELSTGGILSAVQSSSNVGAGAGLALARVSDDLPFKSLIGTAPIIITSNPTDITISLTPQPNTFILGYMDDGFLGAGVQFEGIFSNDPTSTEFASQGFLAFGFTIKRFTIHIGTNTSDNVTIFSVRENGVDVPNTTITIPAGATGSFDSGAISESIASNSLIGFRSDRTGSTLLGDFSLLLECEK